MLRIFLAAAMALVVPGAMASTPDFAEACYQAATEPPALRITDRILGYCTKALESTTDSRSRANLLTNRAILHIKRNDRTQAHADLSEALKADPGSLPARITRSHLFWLEGNLAAAEEVLAEVPGDSVQALVNRSIIRRTRGDMAGAMRDALTVAGYDESRIASLTPDLAVDAATPVPGLPTSIPEDAGAPATDEAAPENNEEDEPIERD